MTGELAAGVVTPDAGRLPERADYVVLGSRVALGLDGGFAVAVASRLRQVRDAGGSTARILTVDGATPQQHAERRAQFVARGLAASADDFRNLFDDVASDPGWLAAAARPGQADPTLEYRVVTDAAGRPVLSLPVVHDPAWHRSTAPVVVHAAGGDRVLDGFAALYITWLEYVADGMRAAAGDPERLFVVVCESRQLGELLAGWRDPRVRIVHTVHNSHLPAPYDDPQATLAPPWARWLEVADRFDAVLWPTRAQRDDVAARFGDPGTFRVVPNPVTPGPEPSAAHPRPAATVVMVNRLADQKRVDRAIRAWRTVVDAVPDATLDIYGDGPLRDDLQGLVDRLGLGASVRLRGTVTPAERDRVFDRATLFLVSTAFEGQGLSIVEALGCGLPVVSFDVRYGPADAVGDAGILVAPGDVDGLAAAVIALLRDPAKRARLSARARRRARSFTAEAVRPALVAALTAAVGHPSRRA